MISAPGSPKGGLRAAELLGATCLATDLGMGFPFEHGLHATLIAMRLCDLLEFGSATASEVYYACLLMYAGCTTDADVATDLFGSRLTENVTPVQFGPSSEVLRGVLKALPPPGLSGYRRAIETTARIPKAARTRRPHFTALCEVASMLAERLGLPDPIPGLFAYITERWDGKSVLRRAKEDAIPESLRLVHVAREAAFQALVGGHEHAIRVVGQRAGVGLDPRIARAFVAHGPAVLDAAQGHRSAWEATIDREPRPWLYLDEADLDRALGAIGDFADLLSPYLSGHSSGVGKLAGAAASVAGFDDADASLAARAGLIHDVGRVAVHPEIWLMSAPLSADQWEQVRLHPYQTERIFSRCEPLGYLAGIAGRHHERLDGHGYHRGLGSASLSPPARLVAIADIFQAMTEPRAHRPARTPEAAAEALAAEVSRSRLDADLVAAVIEAAGQPVPSLQRPAGLTERESEVIGLVARGLQTKQVARALEISAKTADTHIQRAYRKLGVSTRASATLAAMEHGLVPSGELPMQR